MKDLIHHPGGSLEPAAGRASVRLPARVRKGVAAERGNALIRSERVTGRAFVAHVGLTHTAQLSQAEEACIQMAPLGEARFRHICDSYAMFVAGEVGRP